MEHRHHYQCSPRYHGSRPRHPWCRTCHLETPQSQARMAVRTTIRCPWVTTLSYRLGEPARFICVLPTQVYTVLLCPGEIGNDREPNEVAHWQQSEGDQTPFARQHDVQHLPLHLSPNFPQAHLAAFIAEIPNTNAMRFSLQPPQHHLSTV
ncbi:hypothetical protein P171DRAFT_516011, partial [Karstenula rhodostoma CBS 690.94]